MAPIPVAIMKGMGHFETRTDCKPRAKNRR